METTDEAPICPIHLRPMVPCTFHAKADSILQGIVEGFKCFAPGCAVLYANALEGYCTLTADGKPVLYPPPK
jgi:hypothetical protein